jgi:hypothetical protein
LAELFRGEIEDPREFFERIMAGKFKHEDRTALIIPYRSVINWHRQECHFFKDSNVHHRACACGCGLPVFDRKKWASPACRKKIQRRNVTDGAFVSRQVPENVDVKVGGGFESINDGCTRYYSRNRLGQY